MEEMKEELVDGGQDQAADSNVVVLFGRMHKKRERPATDEEIQNFRQNWPKVLRMLAEYEKLRATGGCPVMSTVLPPR